MINKIDTIEEGTENYNKYRQIMDRIDLITLKEITDIIETFVNVSTLDVKHWFNYLDTITSEMLTDVKCSSCGDKLYLSDLPQYDYVCLSCNENY